MNKFSNLFITLTAATMALSSCSSDEPRAIGVDAAHGDFYATLTLSLPQGSRSATIEPGDENAGAANTDPSATTGMYEIGNDSENNIGSLIILIAGKDASGNFKYVASSLANANKATGSTPTKPVYNVQFDTHELAVNADQEVYVFAYCNPTPAFIEASENKFEGQDFANFIGNINDASITNHNGFLMTNALLATATLPSEEAMLETYNSPDKAYHLGTVKVERVSARFDFKETSVIPNTNNLYPIRNQAVAEGETEGAIMGYVQLDSMALFNQANEYYYLPRVSDNGYDTDVEICGQETPTNYLVTPGASYKGKNPLDMAWVSQNFSLLPYPEPYTTANMKAFNLTALEYEALNTSLGDDIDDGWNPGGKLGDYHIWKYTTENVIPNQNYENTDYYQSKGVTTGICFKGHLVPNNTDVDLAAVINHGQNPIYAYDGLLYGDLTMLKAYILENPVSTIAEIFKTTFGVNEISEETLATVTTDATATIPGGFAIYRPEKGQYNMYYTYMNRHNDNANNVLMHSMEFSVVRNNVYKIAVNNILQFGHPGDPGDDPDPEEPDDPDESSKTYFRVTIEVLPWVVRINNVTL